MTLRSAFFFVLGALFAAGAIQAYRNIDECRAIIQRDSTPKSITAADLAANGPGRARFLSITDYEMERRDIVITKWEKANGFIGASIVLRPKGRPPIPGQPRVVVMISATTDAEIEGFLRKTGPIMGTVTNDYVDGVAQPHEREVEGRSLGPSYFIDEGAKPRLPADSDMVVAGLSVLALACFGAAVLSPGKGRLPKSADLRWHAPTGSAPETSSQVLRTAALLPQQPTNRPGE